MNEKILVVAQDSHIRQALIRLLKCEDYEVVEASNAKEAKASMEQSTYAVLLVDHDLEGNTALELIAQVNVASPCTSKLMLSGHMSQVAKLLKESRDHQFQVVLKPWSNWQLIELVRKGMNLFASRSGIDTGS